MTSVLLYLLAVVGAITVSAAAGLFLYGWWLHKQHKRAARARRDERARAIRADDLDERSWRDFAVDHGLNKIRIPKEWK